MTISENKKRKTDSGHVLGPNIEINVGSDIENFDTMGQENDNRSKNVFGAGAVEWARLSS